MPQKNFAVPPSKGEVAAKLLKFGQGAQPTVEEARQAMIDAGEAAVTVRNGSQVPKFIREAAARGTGGNTPVVQHAVESHPTQREVPATRNEEVQNSRTAVALRYNAQQKLKVAGFRNGASVDLVKAVQDGILDLAEAEALYGRSLGMIVEEPVEEQPAVIEPPVVVVADTVESDERETIDTRYFTGVQYKDGKLWVAEITYKNGAGTERFSAPTLKALNMKLLEGKGHGTVKIRKFVEDDKLGRKFNTWDDFYADVQEEQGISQAEFLALPEKSQNIIYDAYQTGHITQFLDQYTEYYKTPKNWEYISAYLKKKDIPLTLHNLKRAYEDLTDDDILIKRPTEEVVTAPARVAAVTPVLATPVVPAVEDSTPAATPLRKRGTTGLVPGQSSATPSLAVAEDGTKPRVLSDKELRALPIGEHRRLAINPSNANRRY